MKKTSLLLAVVLLLCLTACGRKEPEDETPPVETGPLHVETLAVEISKGALGAQQLSAAVKELPETLQALFTASVVEIGQVTVTVGSSSAATAQALAEGHIDLAFLPAEAFLQDGGSAAALLADAQQPQPDGGFWEAGTTALLRAGASPYGGQLAARSSGDPLTWEELENARWGISETGAAYDCLDLWLSANVDGARVTDLPQVTLYEDDVALLEAALAGEVDVLALRREGWTQAADESAEAALPMLAETEMLCSQVAAVSPQREELAGERFAAVLEEVLRHLGEERPELAEALGAQRFTAVEDGDLDSARRLFALNGDD